MSFAQLSVICLVALLGPLLAYPRGWHLPVLLGELMAGVALGRTGLGYLDPGDPTFAFVAEIGFVLVMFVAGTHVPVANPALRPALAAGTVRAAAVGLVATALGIGLARAFDLPHAALFAVLMASSSAALILPVLDSLRLTGGAGAIELLPQVAVADAACVVALPLAVDPAHVWRAAAGALAVVGATLLVFVALRTLERRGIRERVHDVSEERKFAVELRAQLTIVFALAALAAALDVSIMLAGFALGLAVAAIGEPRRLARQLFALTEGFLGPVFFVWLGSELNLRELGSHPRLIVLGLCLGAGALLAHLAARPLGQRMPWTMLATAQLGVPVAAATIGTQLHVLVPGEASALMLGALVSIAVAIAGGGLAARRAPVPSGRPAD